MLANELKSSGNFTLVERQSINKVLSEQELAELASTRWWPL
jgi:curli biogenesis system outer membrane secretion channel CsgG